MRSDAGKFSNPSPGTWVFSCTSCDEGRYQALVAQSNCTECIAGKASSSVGATSEAVCVICDAGKIANRSASASCRLCDTGKYLTNLGTDAAKHDEDSDCAECTLGKLSSDDRISW